MNKQIFCCQGTSLCRVALAMLCVVMLGVGTSCEKNGDVTTSGKQVAGMLTGEFSVSPTVKVHFSKGNLQYNPATDSCRFAENQWEICGMDNALITDISFDGWLDLFGWGTGDSLTRYSMIESEYAEFTNWLTRPLTNGDNTVNDWRALSGEEWSYLFMSRDSAAYRFGLGRVNGVHGVILLPDQWTLPEGLTFKSGQTAGLAAEYSKLSDTDYYNDGTLYNHYVDNLYTMSQWYKMEDNGAVFLPAAGYRWEGNVFNPNISGLYWGTTPDQHNTINGISYTASSVSFAHYFIYPAVQNQRIYGYAVRLVR